jgi:hypothetical protein
VHGRFLALSVLPGTTIMFFAWKDKTHRPFLIAPSRLRLLIDVSFALENWQQRMRNVSQATRAP